MKKFFLILFFILFSFVSAWGAFISYPKFQAFDDNGDPLASGKVYTYDPGTTDAKTTYSDYDLVTSNSNPIILDSRGEADIYCSGSVKLVIKTSANVTINTVDNFPVVDSTLIQDADTDTKVQVEESSDEDIIRFDTGGTEQVIINDGSITPTTDNDIDLGTSSKYFKTVYANVIYASPIGYLQRSKFRWKDGDEIYIGAGRYHHAGTTDQTVYWNSEITFELESAGSNAASDDYGADGWHYIYLDDSAIVTQASPLLDADCFLNDMTAPSYSAAKHGWYNSNDRCIFAVYETGGAILEFWHDGGDLVLYDAMVADYANTDPGTDWSTEVTLTIPDFSVTGHQQKARCFLMATYVDGSPGYGYWRTTDSSAASAHFWGPVEAGCTRQSVMEDVFCNEDRKIDIKVSNGDNDTVAVSTKGWYFPNDM